jgi:hypothetical protein
MALWNGPGLIPPDDSVTDQKIGNRTISDAAAPTDDTGLVTVLFGWLANMIKSITGKSNWRTAPSKTLEDVAGHINDTTTNPHNVTAAQVGAETPAGAQAKVDDLAGAGRTTETVKGNADAHAAHLAENATDAHAAMPACRVYHSVNQSIASGVLTALAFANERFDTDTIHDPVTNNSRLTCKTAGIYYVFGNISWGTNLTTGTRGLYIRANGTDYIAVVQGNPTTEAGKNTIQNIGCIVQLAANEYLELMAFQSQGSSVDVVAAGNYSHEFGMVKVG